MNIRGLGRRKSGTILMADDDPEDQFLVKEAFLECQLAHDLRFVDDGVALLDYLHQRGQYQDPDLAPRPTLILLDLNMPCKDGREVLQELKVDPKLRSIPIVILTTSRNERDVTYAYDLGANSYLTKPVTFDGLVTMLKCLVEYWFEVVVLPPEPKGGKSRGS